MNIARVPPLVRHKHAIKLMNLICNPIHTLREQPEWTKNVATPKPRKKELALLLELDNSNCNWDDLSLAICSLTEPNLPVDSSNPHLLFASAHASGTRTLLRTTKFIGLRHVIISACSSVSLGVFGTAMPMSAHCKYLVVAVAVGLIAFTLQEADAQWVCIYTSWASRLRETSC